MITSIEGELQGARNSDSGRSISERMCVLIKTFGISMVLFLSALGSALLAQSDAGVCPVDRDERVPEARTSEADAMTYAKGFTVPRKQMLMEMITSVY
jgi:hypothetical protein